MNTGYNIEPLIQARKLRRMSFAELAYRTGVTEDMIRKIESGARQPSEKTIFGMSKALDVPMSAILEKKRRAS